MRHVLGLLIVCAIVMSGCKSAAAKDEDALQGTWVLHELEVEGEKAKLDEFNQFVSGEVHLVITGTEMKFVVVDKDGKEKEMKEGGPSSGKFKLDASKSPKHIDLIGKKNDGKEETAKSIYEVSGDTLKLCFPKSENAERPTALESSKEKKTTLLTFKKKKKQ